MSERTVALVVCAGILVVWGIAVAVSITKRRRKK